VLRVWCCVLLPSLSVLAAVCLGLCALYWLTVMLEV
jgi:hypothetical protein